MHLACTVPETSSGTVQSLPQPLQSLPTALLLAPPRPQLLLDFLITQPLRLQNPLRLPSRFVLSHHQALPHGEIVPTTRHHTTARLRKHGHRLGLCRISFMEIHNGVHSIVIRKPKLLGTFEHPLVADANPMRPQSTRKQNTIKTISDRPRNIPSVIWIRPRIPRHPRIICITHRILLTNALHFNLVHIQIAHEHPSLRWRLAVQGKHNLSHLASTDILCSVIPMRTKVCRHDLAINTIHETPCEDTRKRTTATQLLHGQIQTAARVQMHRPHMRAFGRRRPRSTEQHVIHKQFWQGMLIPAFLKRKDVGAPPPTNERLHS